MKSYRDLKVWQLAIDVAVEVHKVTADFPKAEMYGLVSQMRRAAGSIAFNIAEGHARDSTRDFLRFLAISCGSLAELETQLIVAQRVEYITDKQHTTLTGMLDEVSRMLRGLQRALKAKLRD